MIAYFDTSALGMLVLLDAGWEELAGRIDTDRIETAYSDFGWGEVVSAISLRLRRGAFTSSQADDALADARRYLAGWRRLICEPADLDRAARMVAVFDLKLSLPDAIHVAVAERFGHLLITADTRQAAAARALGVSVFNPLEEPR